MESSRLPAELRELVERVATHPHGLGFLHNAYLDGVAVTLGVHPFVVEAARELLETPSGRATMIEEVRLARERLRRESLTPAGGQRRRTESTVSDSLPPPKSAEDLITEARTSPHGIRFLLQAPPETVAVTFGVHPFIVFRARGMVRARKARSREVDSEEEG